MHALVLAAAMFVPGSAEDPAVLIESCRDYVEYENVGATKGNPAMCLGYIAGFGSALRMAEGDKYTKGKANICFRDDDPVQVEEVARKVVELADSGRADFGPSSALTLVAIHYTSNCDR